MRHFSGKAVIVTGGAQGIGKAIARHLLDNDARVLIADIDSEAGGETLEEYRGCGAVAFVQTDVSDEASVERAVGSCVKQFGMVYGLVNNAALARAGSGPVEQLSLEHWNRVIGTNLTGYFLCAKHAAVHLRAAKGAIVNIASTRALMSEPNGEAYAASKGGVVALTHALANSLGPDVRVNCISPGWISCEPWRKKADRSVPQWSREDHAQHPAGRVGEPADIAEMTVYLLSAQAGFITGQNFVIDGGMTKKMIYV